jgi:hypothetical protein
MADRTQLLDRKRSSGVDQQRINDLHGESWRAFLRPYFVRGAPGQGCRFNGMRLRCESDYRTLYRWLREGVCPTLWGADTFLTRHGLHIDLYFAWCRQTGRESWRLGHPPAWHEEEIDPESLAEWREEGEVDARGALEDSRDPKASAPAIRARSSGRPERRATRCWQRPLDWRSARPGPMQVQRRHIACRNFQH